MNTEKDVIDYESFRNLFDSMVSLLRIEINKNNIDKADDIIQHSIDVSSTYIICKKDNKYDDVNHTFSIDTAGYILAALLHDLMEECKDVDKNYIKYHIESNDDIESAHRIAFICAKSVDILTRRKDETYNEYIDRVLSIGDKEVIRIKICDIIDHLSRFESLKPSLVKRYIKALETITTSMTKEDNENE